MKILLMKFKLYFYVNFTAEEAKLALVIGANEPGKTSLWKANAIFWVFFRKLHSFYFKLPWSCIQQISNGFPLASMRVLHVASAFLFLRYGKWKKLWNLKSFVCLWYHTRISISRNSFIAFQFPDYVTSPDIASFFLTFLKTLNFHVLLTENHVLRQLRQLATN